MNRHRSPLVRVALLALGLLFIPETQAAAQYPGYGYGGYGGGFGGYGGYGGGFGGYGGGYGGYGGGYGGGFGGYGGYGYGGYGGSSLGGYSVLGYGAYSDAFGLGGVGYPGIAALNPYFSFGLAPLAVENAVFERTVLGRKLPAARPVQGTTRAASSTPVGTGTFSLPR